MKLKYITCSDPREFNDIHDIVNLAKISPRVEIAVQAHPSKMSYGMPRNQWFHELLEYVVRDKYKINLAVHVNREWCDEICRTGKFPKELQEFFDLCHNNNVYNSLVARWQLNIPSGTIDNVNFRALRRLFNSHPERDFIIQYNAGTHNLVMKMHDLRTHFSLLYDASGGRGIAPDHWVMPVFTTVAQGYSGGFSPENVVENLDKISAVAKRPHAYYDENNKSVCTLESRNDIWIDAEGRLKTDDKFDVARARQYILNAENWLAKQR